MSNRMSLSRRGLWGSLVVVGALLLAVATTSEARAQDSRDDAFVVAFLGEASLLDGHPSCVELVAVVAVRMAGVVHVPYFRPGGSWWQRAMVDQPGGFSNLDAMAEVMAFVGVRDVPRPTVGRMADIVVVLEPGIYVAQGWRQDGTGHTVWLWVVAYGQGHVVESSTAEGVRLNGRPIRGGLLPTEPARSLEQELRGFVRGFGVVRFELPPAVVAQRPIPVR